MNKSIRIPIELYNELESIAKSYTGLEKITQEQVFRIILLINTKK